MQYSNFGKFIRYKREVAKLSLNEFAIANEIEPAVLSRIENQKQGIKLVVIEKIAKGFGQTPAELLTEFENSSN